MAVKTKSRLRAIMSNILLACLATTDLMVGVIVPLRLSKGDRLHFFISSAANFRIAAILINFLQTNKTCCIIKILVAIAFNVLQIETANLKIFDAKLKIKVAV